MQIQSRCKKKYVRKNVLTLLGVTIFFCFSVQLSFVHAATFTVYSIVKSDNIASDGSLSQTSTDTITFNAETTATLEEIDIGYRTQSTGTTYPSHLSISGATLGTLSGLNGSWTINVATAGTVKLINNTGQSITTGTQVVIPIQNIVNQYIGDCNGNSGLFYDTCYIDTTTFSDLGITSVDTGRISYGMQSLPSLTFTVAGVASGTTNNGITTGITTTANAIAFGDLIPGQVVYGAQQLTVTTNATNGYTVYVEVANALQGVYTDSTISPFNAPSVSWINPVVWTDPTGTTPGVDTGWIGANTTDTRVSGWSSASAKFGPISGTANPVMHATGPDTNVSAYVSYALEPSVKQPADAYVGQIKYFVVPTY